MLEYHAALAPWAIATVYRKKDAAPVQPLDFCFLRRARHDTNPQPNRPAGREAVLVAPAPATGMRWAKPGERPPSKYAPGQKDDVIDRYDAWARQWKAGGVRRG